MADALLQVLIENFCSLIQRNIGQILGVKKEMEKLSSTLTTIQAMLADAEDKQFQEKAIQNWLIKVKDIAYEIEDILDECATEVFKREQKGRKVNLTKILSDLKIGRRMKEVAERVEAVAAERDKFHLREIGHAPQSSKVVPGRERGFRHSDPDHICGRDEDKEKIVNILVNQVADKKLSVLPIIGVGGLGKTTLAQLVYDDKRVTQHFPIKLWVCVSDNFDSEILLKKIIEFAGEKASGLENLDLAALQRRLLEVLEQKRYLLILDDVWNENQDAWSELQGALACGSAGSSIVVTTRVQKVADIMRTLPVHCLEKLSNEHCWSLFKRRAFREEDKEYPELEKIGRRIVKKCAGVPLAAKALGGLLLFKRKEEEWINVEKSEIWNLKGEEISILPALRLSYYHLPLELRQCFVYCAVFPKDSVIKKQNLIFHWMAHGCISSDGTKEVEDVGDRIWNELVLRSFIQEAGTNRRGQTTFKMHDLVHDLAQSIMENKIPRAETKSSSSARNNKIREVHFGEHFEISPSSITLQVSTLTNIMNFNRLRILKLRRASMEKLPSAICKLKYLRYLDLKESSIHTLPQTFCSLWNLQILILNYCRDLKSLPKNIRYMTNLRHIFLEHCRSLSDMPSRIGELTSLKTLSLFIIGERKGNDLDELELLNLGGKLEIRHLERVQNCENAKKSNLVNKPNLRQLNLVWESHRTSEWAKMDEEVIEALEPHPNLETLKLRGFRGSYFPHWMTKMENVTKIKIWDCPNCSSLLRVGDLPRLELLNLGNLVALEYIVDDEIQGQNSARARFPSLVNLALHDLPNLKGLLKEEAGESMFPNLRGLYIADCPLLILPPLSTLEELFICSCSLLTLSSVSKFENLSSLMLDFDKINMTTCNIPEESLMEGLCNLKKLKVWNARQHRLPEKWFPDLKSLTSLEIIVCNIGSCFPEGWLGHFTALETLSIQHCKELVEVPEEIKYLPVLKRLILVGLPEMVSLPQGLQHVTSLQTLQLWKLPQLVSLPDWLGNLTSLTNLDIYDCPMIPSLPSSIQGMTNLTTLSIRECPQLARRCEKEKGEDWHKIAHIPKFYIF